MRCALLCWAHLSLLLVLIHVDSADVTASRTCPSHCGSIEIPYPFGIGMGCYLNEWFAIQCNNSTSGGEFVPYLTKINKEVVKILLPNPNEYHGYIEPEKNYGSLRIKTNITSMGCFNKSDEIKFGEPLNFTGTPFTIGRLNTFQAIGCNYKATLNHLEPRLVGCISTCEPKKKMDNTSCNGHKCCQADPPTEIGQIVGIGMEDFPSNMTRERGCRVAFLSDEPRYRDGDLPTYPAAKATDPQWFYDRQYVILQLRWAIPMTNLSFIDSLGCNTDKKFGSFDGSDFDSCLCRPNTKDRTTTAACRCASGYTGNPYILGGCKDIDECQPYKGHSGYCSPEATCVNTPGSYHCEIKKDKTMPITIGLCVGLGVLMLFGVSLWLYKFIKKRRKIKRKQKFFKRNGGLLLKQQLTSTEGSIEKTKVFTSKELEKATENFSLTRVLGQGGQGTVYKGMLVDGRIVAVKKSKVVDEDKLDEFINEVVILSQINHRNIVKLIGCCLETQVPLLVYEFISNGNLFEHLHDEFDEYTMMTTWDMRLRIIIDVAGALSYLHSAASSPIFHRDVKTTNIMLDEKYRAKVADFGTSRSVTVDHTHLTTVVSGTVGYMDPEYFQSSQFTDKSDVYSFGVVLVELITGEKPVSILRSQENRTLATYFILAMKEDRLVDIIDPRIRDGCKLEEVMAAAKLARRCLNLNGKKRPSMREVSMELERIRSSAGDSQPSHVHIVEDDVEEAAVELNIGVESYNNNVGVTAPSVLQDNVASSSWLDTEPLFPRQTW